MYIHILYIICEYTLNSSLRFDDELFSLAFLLNNFFCTNKYYVTHTDMHTDTLHIFICVYVRVCSGYYNNFLVYLSVLLFNISSSYCVWLSDSKSVSCNIHRLIIHAYIHGFSCYQCWMVQMGQIDGRSTHHSVHTENVSMYIYILTRSLIALCDASKNDNYSCMCMCVCSASSVPMTSVMIYYCQAMLCQLCDEAHQITALSTQTHNCL